MSTPWLDAMREMVGTKEYAGGDNNPTILGWARHIGLRYPEMGSYSDGYKHDSIPFCGLGAAYALTKVGIRPPFGEGDTRRFLWAQSFADPGFSDRLDAPRVGCVVVFKWASGGGHVGFLDRVEGRTLHILGANQSDAVNVTPFAWNNTVVGFFWPKVGMAAEAAPERTPNDVKRRMGKAITLAEARRDVQGHLAVFQLASNDGGGAYEVAGINIRYHPVAAEKLKSLIESKQFAEAESFVGDYTATFTDVADLWTVSWGVEFYLRDCVFNRGPTGAVYIMQRALLLRGEQLGESGKKRNGVDGEVGVLTAAAMRRQEGNVDTMLLALRQAREDYEREDVGFRANFWNGLINRFNNALTVARRFHAEQPKESTMPEQPSLPPPSVIPQIPGLVNVGLDQKSMEEMLRIAQIVMLVMQMSRGGQMQVPLLPGLAQPEPIQMPPVSPVQVPVMPTQVVPAKSDTFATSTGFLGLLFAAAGQMFGFMPTVGDTATMVGPAVTATSLLATAGGALGAFSPTLGLLMKIVGPLISKMTAK